jgi:hypothetical protein
LAADAKRGDPVEEMSANAIEATVPVSVGEEQNTLWIVTAPNKAGSHRTGVKNMIGLRWFPQEVRNTFYMLVCFSIVIDS